MCVFQGAKVRTLGRQNERHSNKESYKTLVFALLDTPSIYGDAKEVFFNQHNYRDEFICLIICPRIIGFPTKSNKNSTKLNMKERLFQKITTLYFLNLIRIQDFI